MSKYFFKNESNNVNIRKEIFTFINDNKKDYITYFEGLTDKDGNELDKTDLMEKYINEYNKNGKFAGDLEISAAIKLYKVNIIIIFLRIYLW